MRLNRGRPRAFPAISFSFVTRGDGHRDRIKALGLCRIDRYDRGMGFWKAGEEGRGEGWGWSHGESSWKGVGWTRGSERKGVVYCTFVSFSGYTTEKSYDGGGKGADRQGITASRFFERTFSANKGFSSFFLSFHFFFLSGMKKRVEVGEGWAYG